MKNHHIIQKQRVAAGCIFLASKSVGDAPRKLGDIVTVFYYIQTAPESQVLPISEVRTN